MPYYTKTVRETLKELKTSESGLTTKEADKRFRAYGPNTLQVATEESLWHKLTEPFSNVFMLVLFIATLVSILNHTFLNAIIVMVTMAVSIIIYYIQQFLTERILRALKKHETLDVEVFRDGGLKKIDSSRLVPGDIIALLEGEKVPADVRLLMAHSLRIDESQLTGESTPVNKQTDALTGRREAYQQRNLLFQGSFIVAGEATGIIIATGNNTEFGKLAALTNDISTQSPVQKKIDTLLSRVVGVIAGVALVAFGLSLLRGVDITDSLRFVIALSVSAVPESLPVAITVILVLGMRRMATKKALIRTMRSIETIGVITTIATDKTGTLTKNMLTVHEVWHPHGSRSTLAKAASYAANHTTHKLRDPLDTALDDFARAEGVIPSSQQPLGSLSFDQITAMSGNIWHSGSKYDLVIKGAPEQVLNRCELTENEREQANLALRKLAANGYRVIAIAHRLMPHSITKFSQLTHKDLLTLDGFVAVADVLRPEAKKAIQAALKAGVTVRMITGDHFETAYYIGRQLGMAEKREQVFDSGQMNVMSDDELEEVIGDIRIFSRVIPEHKYRILALLKKNNITAMTGDGINDVPALANAHVGVAMGSGTSIAKDAGDIILIDDNFKSIVDAMHEGRTIFANIRRMLFYLLSTNAGEVLTMLGALVIGLPIPLVPVQILWVNLVTDTAMVIPLGLEPGEKLHLNHKPNAPGAPILGKLLISRMILIAFSMAGLTLWLYVFYSSAYGHEYGQTIAFSALVVMQWASAFSARSDDESLLIRIRTLNGKFYVGLSIAITLQLFAIFGPLSSLLHVTRVTIGDLVVTSTIAFLVPIILVEIHKFIGRHSYQRGN